MIMVCFHNVETISLSHNTHIHTHPAHKIRRKKSLASAHDRITKARTLNCQTHIAYTVAYMIYIVHSGI